MTKVYIVSRGSYSDYSVSAVFADREMAEAHRHEVDGGNEVEEFELVTEPPTRFLVYNKSNDTYRGREPHEWTYPQWSYRRGIYKRAEVTEYDRGGLCLRVTGWDEGAVRKAFDDRWAEIQAHLAGIE